MARKILSSWSYSRQATAARFSPHMRVRVPGGLRSTAVAERALSRQHDVALMRAFGTGAFAAAVDRGAKEVGPRVDARRVDVVVLREVAHGECWPRPIQGRRDVKKWLEVVVWYCMLVSEAREGGLNLKGEPTSGYK